ncbi:hypothetical protein WN943_004753 [Citrus x changshan-huyou]
MATAETTSCYRDGGNNLLRRANCSETVAAWCCERSGCRLRIWSSRSNFDLEAIPYCSKSYLGVGMRLSAPPAPPLTKAAASYRELEARKKKVQELENCIWIWHCGRNYRAEAVKRRTIQRYGRLGSIQLVVLRKKFLKFSSVRLKVMCQSVITTA